MSNNIEIKLAKMSSIKERAEYLLNIGVTAKLEIIDLNVIYQAKVGDIFLPIYGNTENDTIISGVDFLIEKL